MKQRQKTINQAWHTKILNMFTQLLASAWMWVIYDLNIALRVHDVVRKGIGFASGMGGWNLYGFEPAMGW